MFGIMTSRLKLRTFGAGWLLASMLALGLGQASGPGIALATDGGAGRTVGAHAGWMSCSEDQGTRTCAYTSMGLGEAYPRQTSSGQHLEERVVCLSIDYYSWPVFPEQNDDNSTQGGGGAPIISESGCAQVPSGSARIDGLSSADLSPMSLTLDKQVCGEAGCESLGSRQVTIAATWQGTDGALAGFPYHEKYQDGDCTVSLGQTFQERAATVQAILDAAPITGDEGSAILAQQTYKEQVSCR
ncbi:MAG: hypothetical protein M3Q29_22040 [Chloroflexota bacterium]|nr:hypothetical protein [Chloroflexota bacterium]